MVIDHDNNATIIYVTGNRESSAVWAVTFKQGIGPGTPVRIGENTTGYITNLEACVDDHGNIVVAWMAADINNQPNHGSGSLYHYDAWAARFEKDKGWQQGQLLEDDPSHLNDLTVACDREGNAIVSWVYAETRLDLMACHFNVDRGWQVPVKIYDPDETNSNQCCKTPTLAFDQNDNAYLAWIYRKANGSSANSAPTYYYIKKYTTANGWENTHLLMSVESTDTPTPQLQFDHNGNGFASCLEKIDGGQIIKNHIFRYTPSNGWAGSTEFMNEPRTTQSTIAFDSQGNGVIAWCSDKSNGNYIYIARYNCQSGWEKTIESRVSSEKEMLHPFICCDHDNVFMIAYGYNDRSEPTNSLLKGLRFDFQDGVVSDEVIFRGPSGYTNLQDLNVDHDNNFYVLFKHYTDYGDSYSGFYNYLGIYSGNRQ